MVELIWDGKYDANGRRTAPPRLKLPFQTVETVNESSQQRQMAFDLFSTGRPAEWRNRLIWGDKKYVLPALVDEFAGKVDLIYIDPPFDTGADFSYQVSIEDEDFTKAPNVIEQKAYRDTWGHGLDSYMQWFYETTLLLHELLTDVGSLYVHIDWHVGHYAKSILDEVFGTDNFRNEIIWNYSGWNKQLQKHFERRHDTIFFYSKTSANTFNSYAEPYESLEAYLATRKQKLYRDEDGREYTLDTRNGGKRVNKVYVEDAINRGKPVDSVWKMDKINNSSKESSNYPTQKPEALLERIIQASSNENDLVLDCFCGSGTTAAVAEKLNRRWITCDLGRFAIHTTRKRLLSIPQVKPFVVQNLGKYERQAWQVAEFGSSQKAAEIGRQYHHFILDLYQARPIDGYTWLHGLKQGRMVHVGPVDSPISPSDVTQIAIEFRKAMGTGKDAPGVTAVDVLGWDFAFELNEVAKQQAAQANITMRFLRIPREVLEQKAVDQGDIHFFELAALSVESTQKGRDVTLKLTDFVIPPDDVPEDVQRAISHWAQWIDYWAVDWDNKDDTFHNMWQTYRTRQDKSLQLQTTQRYDQPGEYTILIKAIDILGNDTTKTFKIIVH
ncbi:MAG: site-specific DNA-methyltransferase [Anaerolineae bacterium]|nr:site-specific DNA-methyltransferase [Anaerolineae bacterium]